MALVFTDGFDHYMTADLLKKWTGFTNASTISDVNGPLPGYARPPGGMGIQLTSGTGARGIYKTLAATHTSFVSGFNIYFPSAVPTSTSSPFWAVYDTGTSTGTTVQLALRGDAGGHLVVAAGGSGGSTVLTTSTNTFSAGVWYHIEIKATINNTTGSYEVKVNGSSTGWITAQTGKNTRGQSSNNYVDAVSIQSAGLGSNGPYFDDLYFLSSASPNNDFVGPQKVLTLFPAGSGNYAQWTGNYAANYINVSELGGDGDSTFNQSATANQIDSFVFDDVPSGTVTGVAHTLMVRQDAGAARQIAPLQRSSSTDYVGTTFNCAGSYQFLQDCRDTDPATSAAYTASNLSSAEFGYKLIA